jgi:hypothetical protein
MVTERQATGTFFVFLRRGLQTAHVFLDICVRSWSDSASCQDSGLSVQCSGLQIADWCRLEPGFRRIYFFLFFS